tara:strand:+ start:6235 stop:6933 length:699 start_codon:yes stop_codon:yes gene_type:complete
VDFIEEIREHFKNEYPREGCGILTVVKGKQKWIPCTNIAEENNHFIIDTKEYLKIARTSDIIGIVHSHPDESSEPSELDINNCNALGKKYYIFSYPEMDLTIVEPEINTTDLYGREYEFGVKDCFEALRDYLKTQNIDIPPRAMFVEDYWDKDIDYFNDKIISDWQHSPVSLNEIKENDVLIFRVFSNINNHCGVYLGNDIFYHHAENRLSCRENLYPQWKKWLVGAYRYEA